MTADTKNDNVNSEKISITELLLNFKIWWRYILSKWLVILFAGILGATLGLIYAFTQKTAYTAELSFALDDEKGASGGLGGAMGLASQFGFDLSSDGGGAFSGDNLIELMKSRSMIEKALLAPIVVNGKQETLVESYINFNKLRNKWKDDDQLKQINFPLNADRSKFSLKQDSLLGSFYNKIVKNDLTVAKADKKLSIITIRVTSENELFSKNFAEIIAKTVSDFYIDTKTKRSTQNVLILQHQVDSVRAELNSAIRGVASSVDVNPNPNPSLRVLLVPSQKRQVDVQANQAILTQLIANLEISKVALRKETPLIQVIDSPILPLSKQKPGKLSSMIIGGVLTTLLMTVILFFNRLFKDMITE